MLLWRAAVAAGLARRPPAVAPSAAPTHPSIALPDPPEGVGCRVVVVDTGLAADGLVPAGLAGSHGRPATADYPDADLNGELDAATGHATFIAGIVRRLAPSAKVEVRQVLTTFGDASDSEVAEVLVALLDDRPDVVNLSFAGYTDDDTTPPAIAEAIAALLAEGVVVVAAAGNDSTCRPAWPAATDGVIGVAALDDDGPAWFTNHGPWVQACAPGVDVLSPFFDYAGGSADPATTRPAGGPDNAAPARRLGLGPVERHLVRGPDRGRGPRPPDLRRCLPSWRRPIRGRGPRPLPHPGPRDRGEPPALVRPLPRRARRARATANPASSHLEQRLERCGHCHCGNRRAPAALLIRGRATLGRR